MKQLYDFFFFFFCTNVKFSLRMLLFHPSEKPPPERAVVIALLSDAPVVSVVPDLD